MNKDIRKKNNQQKMRAQELATKKIQIQQNQTKIVITKRPRD